MKLFLDPRLYVYGEEEWENRSFEPRFEALISMFTDVDEIENNLNLPIFRFKASDKLYDLIFGNLPYTSAENGYYHIQYVNIIYKNLMRRFDFCPCSGGQTNRKGRLPNSVAPEDHIVTAFIESLRECVDRGCLYDSSYVFYFGERGSCVAKDDTFGRFVDIGSQSVLSALDPVEFFPTAGNSNKEELLNFSLKIMHNKLKERDPRWTEFELRRVVLTDRFWNSFYSYKYGADVLRLYIERILYSIVQVASNIDIDIEKHDMSPQSISYEGVNRHKWNAYVFKMRASSNDQRCSRIYYSHVGEIILADEFDGDAHP